MAFIAKWQASPNNPGRDMARAPCVVVTSDPGEQSVQVLGSVTYEQSLRTVHQVLYSYLPGGFMRLQPPCKG